MRAGYEHCSLDAKRVTLEGIQLEVVDRFGLGSSVHGGLTDLVYCAEGCSAPE